MPLGFEPSLLLNNPVDREFRESMSKGIQAIGKQVSEGITRIATNRQTRDMLEELQQTNPNSQLFPQQAVGLLERYPLAATDKRGLAGLALFDKEHQKWTASQFATQLAQTRASSGGVTGGRVKGTFVDPVSGDMYTQLNNGQWDTEPPAEVAARLKPVGSFAPERLERTDRALDLRRELGEQASQDRAASLQNKEQYQKDVLDLRREGQLDLKIQRAEQQINAIEKRFNRAMALSTSAPDKDGNFVDPLTGRKISFIEQKQAAQDARRLKSERDALLLDVGKLRQAADQPVIPGATIAPPATHLRPPLQDFFR